MSKKETISQANNKMLAASKAMKIQLFFLTVLFLFPKISHSQNCYFQDGLYTHQLVNVYETFWVSLTMNAKNDTYRFVLGDPTDEGQKNCKDLKFEINKKTFLIKEPFITSYTNNTTYTQWDLPNELIQTLEKSNLAPHVTLKINKKKKQIDFSKGPYFFMNRLICLRQAAASGN